jgi:ribosome-associated protein
MVKRRPTMAKRKPTTAKRKTKTTKHESEALVRSIADITLDKKGVNVVVIDVRERSSYTDFLVIASGTSDRHVQSIAEGVDTAMRVAGVKPIGSEGLREGQWALIDFGSVVVHVFHQFTRDVYKLDELWRDAPRLTVEAPTVAKSRRR